MTAAAPGFGHFTTGSSQLCCDANHLRSEASNPLLSDRSATPISRVLERFRSGIGSEVFYSPPGSGPGSPTERGTVVAVSDRVVFVDYGYANPIRPDLGNAIATHPANLRFGPDACGHCPCRAPSAGA
ncbi:hypothetical protein [Nocardia jiangsuensis]|uniref:MBL fold metallo-hydrolase n=1 Tax=Nocardia jiangsuensis TaxID=1691563 RepID=A0ABV8DV44_9NOCA